MGARTRGGRTVGQTLTTAPCKRQHRLLELLLGLVRDEEQHHVESRNHARVEAVAAEVREEFLQERLADLERRVLGRAGEEVELGDDGAHEVRVTRGEELEDGEGDGETDARSDGRAVSERDTVRQYLEARRARRKAHLYVVPSVLPCWVNMGHSIVNASLPTFCASSVPAYAKQRFATTLMASTRARVSGSTVSLHVAPSSSSPSSPAPSPFAAASPALPARVSTSSDEAMSDSLRRSKDDWP